MEKVIKKREILLEKVVSLLKPISEGILLEGSFSWGKDHCVTKKSDIDLEVIFDDNQKILRLLDGKNDNLSVGIVQIIKDHQEHGQDAKFFTFGMEIEKSWVSIRFMPFEIFKKICQLQLTTLQKSKNLLEYRNRISNHIQKYEQRNFFGETINLKRKYYAQKNKGQITRVPIAIINKGKYYPGALVDRYISSPSILFDKNREISKLLKILKINLLSKMKQEEKKFGIKTKYPGLHLALSRYEKIPNKTKQKLKRQTTSLLTLVF